MNLLLDKIANPNIKTAISIRIAFVNINKGCPEKMYRITIIKEE
jgi:hypothetical protein